MGREYTPQSVPQSVWKCWPLRRALRCPGGDPRLKVVGLLAGPKFDDADIGQTPRAERIFPGNPLDRLAILANSENDAAVAGDLSP